MSKNSHVSIGPGSASLILIIVVVSMSVLGTLTLISSRSDYQLSKRSVVVAQTNYTLFDRSERSLAQLLDAVREAGEDADEDTLYELIPESMELDENIVSWEEEESGVVLSCSVELSWEDGAPRAAWLEHRMAREGSEEEFEIWD